MCTSFFLFQEFDSSATEEEILAKVKDIGIIKIGQNYQIVLENLMIKTYLNMFWRSVQLMFGYIWILNLQYPKPNKYFWEFLEKCCMKISQGNTSARILLFERKLKQLKWYL